MDDEHSETGVAQLTTIEKNESAAKLSPPDDGERRKSWWAWFANVDHILALVAILAGVVAIVFEAKVHHDVNNISKNVSTRYLDDWPDHVDDLKALVKDLVPGDEVAINADIGYTHFTRPESFNQYFNALLDAAKGLDQQEGIRVRILVSDEETNSKGIKAQFDPGMPNDFKGINQEQIRIYCKNYSKQIRQANLCTKFPPDYQDFQDAVLYVENDLCDQLTTTGHVKVMRVNDLQRRYRSLWIKHQGDLMKEMIFAYSEFYGPNKRPKKGYAWRTNDGHLIETLLDEFDTEFEKAGAIPENEVKPKDHLYPRAYAKVQNEILQQKLIAK